MIRIGSWNIDSPVILAPMAGVTDLPFRKICRSMGAGLASTEMLTSNIKLWSSDKSRLRMLDDGMRPKVVQLVGNDPKLMAQAAQLNVDLGTDIIDINMGCPTKKVCKKASGSALLNDEALVANILKSVVDAVSIPVTLKIRTGWDRKHRNALQIAKIAEDIGIQSLVIHGRTRECRFIGAAEYDTIANVVSHLTIPVWANGDINDTETAKKVIDYTKACGVMLGRGTLGNPWLVTSVRDRLKYGRFCPHPCFDEIKKTMIDHIFSLHDFYGSDKGSRIARKHFGWYLDKQFQLRQNAQEVSEIKRQFNQIVASSEQIAYIHSLFE